MTVGLLIAEDHDLVQAGLRAAFQDTDIHVVGEATNAAEAVRLASHVNADVLLRVHLGRFY